MHSKILPESLCWDSSTRFDTLFVQFAKRICDESTWWQTSSIRQESSSSNRKYDLLTTALRNVQNTSKTFWNITGIFSFVACCQFTDKSWWLGLNRCTFWFISVLPLSRHFSFVLYKLKNNSRLNTSWNIPLKGEVCNLLNVQLVCRFTVQNINKSVISKISLTSTVTLSKHWSVGLSELWLRQSLRDNRSICKWFFIIYGTDTTHLYIF